MGLWRSLWGKSSREIAIDLGTANTLAHVRGKGVILNEPSVVAVDRTTGAVIAVGAQAKSMLGRTPEHIEAIRPLKDGVIADFEIAEAMLRYFLQRVYRRRALFHPTVAMGVPSGVTEVERRAVRETTLRAGARDALLIEEPMAAAIGAGLPVSAATGSMVVDIGGGTTEVAVIALNGLVAERSERIAGDEMDEAIVEYLHHEVNLAIGLPRDAISQPVNGIADAIRATLEGIPAELAADIIESGIVLTGGGALLRGIDRLLAESIDMPVRVAEDPLSCVVIGAGRALAELDKYADAFATY